MRNERKCSEMIDKTKKLTPTQEKAIGALLSSATLEEAAKTIGVTTVTLRRWRQDKEFANAYRDARFALLDSVTAQLRIAAGKAVQTLESLLDCQASPQTRARAAEAILNLAFKSSEQEDLAARLAAIEERIAPRDKP